MCFGMHVHAHALLMSVVSSLHFIACGKFCVRCMCKEKESVSITLPFFGWCQLPQCMCVSVPVCIDFFADGYGYMQQNGIEDGRKYGAAAVNCLLARSPAPEEAQPSSAIAVPSSAGHPQSSGRASASPNRIQSYSESSMAAQKEWEMATLAGTYTQPTVPKGEEKRRARSDDKVSIQNEEMWGHVYPRSYYPESAPHHMGPPPPGYHRTSSATSQDTMTDRSSSSASVSTSGGGIGVVSDRRWHHQSVGDSSWGDPAGAAAADTSLPVSSSGGSLPSAMGTSDHDAHSTVDASSALSPTSQSSGPSEPAEHSESSTGTSGVHSIHIDATGIKPTSSLPSDQHGPFDGSFLPPHSNMPQGPLSDYNGDAVWSTEVTPAHSLEPPRVTSSISSENVSRGSGASGDATSSPRSEKSPTKPLSANMENLLPQDLFVPAPPSLKRYVYNAF